MMRFLRCLKVVTSIAQNGSPCGEWVSRVEFSSGLLTGSDLADSGADRSSTPRKTSAGCAKRNSTRWIDGGAGDVSFST